MFLNKKIQYSESEYAQIEEEIKTVWYSAFGTKSNPKSAHFLDAAAISSIVKTVRKKHKPLKKTINALIDDLNPQQRKQIKIYY